MKTQPKVRGIFEKVKGSGVWWIRYVDAARKYHREKAGTRGNAEKLLTIRKNDALVGKKMPETLRRPSVPFGKFADAALEYSKKNKRSYRDDEWRMAELKAWFGSRDAEMLTGEEIEKKLCEVADERKWAPGSYNKYRSLLMMAYRVAKLPVNPARSAKHRKENKPVKRYLSREQNGEFERLVAAIRKRTPEHLADFIFALNTGLRLENQFRATYEMIDFTRNVLNLPAAMVKNDEDLHIPLNENALAAIHSLPSWRERKGYLFRNQHHPDKPIKSTEHWFKPALKEAGISKFRWHDLRHTFASWLVQDGVPLERVSTLLGHKSLQMTMRYAHLKPSQLHNDVALLTQNSTAVAFEINAGAAVPATYIN
jgi:integrase